MSEAQTENPPVEALPQETASADERSGVQDAGAKDTTEGPAVEIAGDAETKTNGNAPSERNGDHIRDSVEKDVRRPRRDNFQRGRSNIKSSFESMPESSDHDEIRRQVEFYFSDANLPMDEYLLKSTGGPANKPFPLKEIHTFKRMKHFQPFSAVVDAIKDSKTLNLDDKNMITRKTPLSDNYTNDDVEKNRSTYEEISLKRTIYAKGFGDETETTQTEVEEFFAPYGEVIAARLRRLPNKLFKGSATIEFADEQTAKSFLEQESKPKWQGKRDLEFSSKKAWADEDKAYHGRRRDGGGNRGGRGGARGRGRGGNRGGRGDRDRGDRRRSDRNNERKREASHDSADEVGKLDKSAKRKAEDDEPAAAAEKAAESKTTDGEPQAKKAKVEDAGGD